VGIKISQPKEATMHHRKHRILKALVLAVAVAAFAAPAALGDRDGRPSVAPNQVDFWNYDAQTGKKITNTSPSVPSVDLANVYMGATSTSPDDRTLYRGTEPVGSQLDPIIVDAIKASPGVGSPDDRSLYRGVETPNVPVSVTVTSPSEGFQWSDAGLGAASTLALLLLMGATTLVVRHQRRRIAAF
jgi:hypothetical protein